MPCLGKKMLQNQWKNLASYICHICLDIDHLLFSLCWPFIFEILFLEKTKTSKEEARELQLKEEGHIRDKVMSIQHNISLMLKALGEMAIANPIFTHSQLPSSVSSYSIITNLLPVSFDYLSISYKYNNLVIAYL